MKYKKVLPHIFFVILVGFFVFLNNSNLKQSKIIQSLPINNQASTTKETAKVLRVIDGDTIEVSLNSKIERVRLIGIDSPEVLDERKPIQCFGKEASAKAKEILNGKIVSLESDPTQEERDKYGRLLRYVFLDGMNFNRLMINEGFAHEFTYENNPYKYMEEFKNVERTAREENKGLWNENVCKIP